MLGQLRRPKLLTSAARIAAESYRRERHLTALMGQSVLPRHGAAALRLLEMEAELDRQRRNGEEIYSPARHVSVLSALLGEVALIQAVAA